MNQIWIRVITTDIVRRDVGRESSRCDSRSHTLNLDLRRLDEKTGLKDRVEVFNIPSEPRAHNH